MAGAVLISLVGSPITISPSQFSTRDGRRRAWREISRQKSTQGLVQFQLGNPVRYLAQIKFLGLIWK